MIKVQSNKHYEKITKENDYLGLKPRADQIVKVIRGYYSKPKNIENNMIALYGAWGSGKTSVMYDVMNNEKLSLEFDTIFFNAWEYEGDNNLALSLFDAMCDHFGNPKDPIIETIKKKLKFITGLKVTVKGVKVEIPFKYEEETYYHQLKGFKSDFSKFENYLLNRDSSPDNKRKLIVFIDDLDRCEPEHVLDLLKMIKLFFTFGERTLFFCGVDPNAIKAAVKHRYKDMVNGDLYLEKIFDFTFYMPVKNEIDGFLAYYFKEFSDEQRNLIRSFLTAIEFTNARHLKKVFNKFEILRYLKENSEEESEERKLIPELNNIANLILVLYMIILYEFEPILFVEVSNYEDRINRMKLKLIVSGKDKGKTIQEEAKKYIVNPSTKEFFCVVINNLFTRYDMVIKSLSQNIFILCSELNISEKIIMVGSTQIDEDFFGKYYQIGIHHNEIIQSFKNNVIPLIQNKITRDFIRFLIDNLNHFHNASKESKEDYSVRDLFKMAKTFL